MKTMTTSCDRTRLKDRILANVAKAIKCIQEFQILKAEECDLVLTNSDWQCHKLCEHLDHAFLHGLRHVTHGYWKVVTEFTRKGVVQEVQRLNHVTTDLGRGRSWLYIALNENLLESYMRCFMENTRYVKKYYVKEALVLDQQRLNVLVTLTSGLDYGTFKLEYNMPYLDLSSYQARPKSEQTASRQDEDKVSLCSMESSSSQVSSLMSSSVMSSSDYMHHRGYHDDSSSEKFVRRRTYSASTDSGYQVDTGNGITASRHLSMPNDTASTRALTPSEPRTRISRIESIVNVSESEEADSLEVIHVKSKGEHSKKKKKKVKKSIKKEKSSSDRDSVDSNSRQSKEDVSESTRTTPSEDDQSDIFLHQEPVSHVPITSSSPVNVVSQLSVPKDDSGYGLCEETLSNPEDTETDHEHLLNGKLLQNHIAKSVDKFVQNIQNVKNPDKLILEQAKDKTNRLLTNAEKPSIKTKSDVPVNVNPDSQISNTVGGESSHNHDSKLDEKTMEDQVDQNKSLYSDNTSEKIESQPVGESIYDDNAQILKIRSNTPEKRISHDTLPLTAPVDDPKTKETEIKETNDLDLKVDNNTLLHLMLDVFEHEDEDFNKMYCTRSGHTEGETTIIFLLITNKSLYFLRRTSGKIFTKDASIPFKELDYISLSVGNQVIQIVCTNRRKQFWISVGDAEMTRSILSTVSEALDSSELNLPKLSVLTDATTQKIAMKKYAAKETNTDPQNVRILSYLLVHWEDPSSGANKIQSAHKDGHLLYRTKNSGHSWRTAFLSLRDGLLCLFHSKSDVKPHFFVKLSRETCGGCRRMLSNERNHCFEVVGLKNDSLQLAAENSQEASAWLQVLCQAVAESQQDVVDASRSQSCLPCCLILTPQKILMCHEDVQTSFFRTLGSASVVDVTAITEDTFLKTYLILEFESQDVGITSEQWVLYFNAANERTAFIEAFSAVWTKEFQVDVPIHQVQDVPLQTNCREMANYLRDSLLLK